MDDLALLGYNPRPFIDSLTLKVIQVLPSATLNTKKVKIIYII